MRKRLFAAFVCLCMMVALVPSMAYANDTVYTGGLCEHHPQHDDACGYSEGTAEVPCSHEHTEACYALVTNCVHEHTAECYNEGSTEPICGHVCSEESGCITKELNCSHEHDENCGYVPATEGTPCGFVCEICNGAEEPKECTCSIPCMEDAVDTDCPVCGVDGADLSTCRGEAPMALSPREYTLLFVGGVQFSNAPTYALTKDGSVVTAGASESNYNIKWDGSTLTLKNATITKGNYSYDITGFYVICYLMGPSMNIVLEGDNTIIGPSSGGVEGARNAGIYSAQSDVTISGNGSLNIFAGDWDFGDSYGIYTKDNLVIGGGVKLTAKAGNATTKTSSASTGIEAQGCLTIEEGAEVTAIGGNAIYGSFGIQTGSTLEDEIGLSISGATVHATSGNAERESKGIIGAPKFEIHSSTIDAKSGTTNGESYGLGGGKGSTIEDSQIDVSGFKSGIDCYSDGTISIAGSTVTATGTGSDSYGIYGGKNSSISIINSAITATGTAAGVFVDNNGQVKIGAGLDLYAGESSSNNSKIPYTPEANIKDLISGHKYFHTENARLFVSLSASEANKVYDSEDITLTAASNIPGVTYQWYKDGNLLTDAAGDTLKLKNVNDSGTYQVIAQDALGTASSNEVTITITKATPQIALRDKTMVYTGVPISMDINDCDITLCGDDTVGNMNLRFRFYADPSSGTIISRPSEVGTYYAKVELLETDNYFGAESDAAKWVIAPATLNVNAEGYSGTYDGKGHSITVIADEGATVTYSENGQSYSETNPVYKNAGTYTVYYKVTKPNYQEVVGTETVEIIPAKMNVTAKGYTGIYDGAPHTITITADADATVTYSEDGTSYSASKPSYTDVGTYTVYYKVTKPNYQEVVGTATVEIMPASLTVIAEGYTGIYDGKAHAISVTADAGTTVMYSVNGEPYSETNPSYTDVGTYTVSYKVTKPNYQEVVGTATVEIMPASLTVIAEGYTGIYDGKAHAISVTADAGTTVMYSVNGEPYSENNPSYTDVGTYTVSYKVTKPNYQEVQGVKTVEITPAVLTAAYESETIRVGKTPALKVNVTGFVNGENADTAADYVAPTVTTSETERGRYELTPSGGSARNYTFVYVSGTLTISKPSNGGSVFFWDLKFDTNGGSDINTVTEWEYSTIDLDEYVPEKEGYKFAGWYADKDFDKKIDEVYLTEDTTVYAKWEKIEEEVPEEPEETEEIKETETISFKDVKESDWFHKAVSYAVENGLMSGMSEDIFAPNTPMTREMLAVVLYNVEGQPESTEANTFTDVKADMWYTDAILWANENGIVAGYDNGAYGVGDLITREQFAAILYRYAQFKGYDVSIGADTNILSYADALTISEYAYPAMQWACGAGIMGGMDDGTLMPQGKATRAEAATMLMNFCEKIMK